MIGYPAIIKNTVAKHVIVNNHRSNFIILNEK